LLCRIIGRDNMSLNHDDLVRIRLAAEQNRRNKYVLAWTSGHTPPQVLYFVETEQGWCCTDQRVLAKLFPSKKEALAMWLSKHRFPEDYQGSIDSGLVRAEHYKTPRLWT